LCKWGYDNEDNIRKRAIHIILERYNWFKKAIEDDMKMEMANRNCPFMGPQKKSKSKPKFK
jgi:hypothetical protein